ncbi:MAG: 1,2-phenylacetyl-CoA epoxidase subunit PaaC [Actinomycetes bacterium]
MSAVRPTAATQALPALARYALALGDDALILSHRCAEWIAHAPELEEDVALANIGLDLLGQARMLLTYAGEVEGAGRDEDDLAYLREERDVLNLQICERPNDDFAVSTARLLLFSLYARGLFAQLSASRDERLAAIAAKSLKEVAYHVDHASAWVVRLGDGTAESHARMRAGLEQMWPYVDEMFDGSWIDPALLADGVAVDVAGLRPEWDADVERVLAEATLERPTASFTATGGRQGVHTEALGYLLAEMQHLHRSHPGATW